MGAPFLFNDCNARKQHQQHRQYHHEKTSKHKKHMVRIGQTIPAGDDLNTDPAISYGKLLCCPNKKVFNVFHISFPLNIRTAAGIHRWFC